MKEIIIYVVIALVFVLFMGRTEISFKPFYFRMDGWLQALGWVMIVAGIMFVSIDAHRQGKKDEWNRIQEIIKERIELKLNEEQNIND